MRDFLLGVLVTLVVIVFGGWLYLRLGYADLRADARPSWFESKLVATALEASAARHAPNGTIRFSRLKLSSWMAQDFTGTNAPIVMAGLITQRAIMAAPSIRVRPSS